MQEKCGQNAHIDLRTARCLETEIDGLTEWMASGSLAVSLEAKNQTSTVKLQDIDPL